MNRAGAVCAIVATLGLAAAACTPAEIATVEQAYRSSVEAERASDGPTWSVEADCGGAHVVLTGWTNVTQISPSTGLPYVILGLGATNIGVGLVDGGVDAYVAADQGTRDTPGWSWSLVVNGEPSLTVHGLADC